MQAHQESTQRKPITLKPALGAAVLVGFLVLHVVAIAILRGADTPDGAPTKPMATLQSID
ncbi:hypothetical protein HL667_25410 [Bradyrhizobium sp. 83012]|uniref:Energy transducer TonB n=1 Tax=Bradyrhizobium aeschynomenes TaxID=2734909 RepID=A0ABX2CJL6_9BRAD|nr:hypothetical protein [Bradyrhizobium aeschynomenes]NPU68363.1 hypothetical protein [Bradyrhizobium aeschynomenes]